MPHCLKNKEIEITHGKSKEKLKRRKLMHWQLINHLGEWKYEVLMVK
jgi:hypothetical protein